MSDWDEALTRMVDVVARDFRTALTQAAEARERTYYDAESDRAAASRYYDGVTPEHLGELVTSTHRDEPRYKPSLELYPWVDLHPDGMLRSLYTGEVFEPEHFIEADFAVVQERTIRLTRRRALEEVDTATLEDEVEAQLPFNCEHVVPQSWFGKQEPMRGDLHHLFACESRCNGFRGNTPYAEFPDFPPTPPPEGVETRVVRDDCGKSDAGGFEPAHGKGAAARAVFYFRLRYPEHISVDEMAGDRWRMVLGWHEQDPVSTWELHRNAAIFERQGNRNPFVDHPEWVVDLPLPG
jgi:endonuclease I